jgi:hypothetical protein
MIIGLHEHCDNGWTFPPIETMNAFLGLHGVFRNTLPFNT